MTTNLEKQYADKKILNRLVIRERTVMLKKLLAMLNGEIRAELALDPTHGPCLLIGETFRILYSEIERAYILEINTRNRQNPNWLLIGNQGEFTLVAFLRKSPAIDCFTPIDTRLPSDLTPVDQNFFNRIKND